MLQKKYDVVVVGAGPSGAAAARGLINEGLEVLIIDKKKLPRYKICSGIIFRKSQDITEKYFGEIPKSAYATPELLKGVRLWTDEENYRDWPFSKDGKGAPNVWRSEYDYWLVKNSGAEIKDSLALLDFSINGDNVLLNCRDVLNKKHINLECRYLISAEGSRSVIRTKLGPEFESELRWFIAYQNYYEGDSDLGPYYFHGFLDPQYGDVYAWFSVKDGLQVFGTAVKKGNKIRPFLTKYTDLLKKRFGLKLTQVVRTSSCLGNYMCPKGKFYLGKRNVLLVGEAAGFLNAFGEGISCALTTGLFAAEAISKSAKSKANLLDLYTELTKHERRLTMASWRMGAKIANRDLMPV